MLPHSFTCVCSCCVNPFSCTFCRLPHPDGAVSPLVCSELLEGHTCLQATPSIQQCCTQNSHIAMDVSVWIPQLLSPPFTGTAGIASSACLRSSSRPVINYTSFLPSFPKNSLPILPLYFILKLFFFSLQYSVVITAYCSSPQCIMDSSTSQSTCQHLFWPF